MVATSPLHLHCCITGWRIVTTASNLTSRRFYPKQLATVRRCIWDAKRQLYENYNSIIIKDGTCGYKS